MAVKEYWVGTVGPLLYNDSDDYPDSVPVQALRGAQLHIEDDPTEIYHVSTKTYTDTAGRSTCPVGNVYMNTTNVNPTTELGFGTWSALGTQTIGVTTVYYWSRSA